MQGFENLSEKQTATVINILENDKGFHSTKLIADYPFSAISKETENGLEYVNPCCSFNVSTGGSSYDIAFRYSEELETWFFSVEWAGGKYDGIVHFNTVYNAQDLNAFVILNDATGDDAESIRRNLQFSNFLVMVK